MAMTDSQIDAYVENEKWPCRFCLKDVIDCQKPDGTYMKIAADTDPSKLRLDPKPAVRHKALYIEAPSQELPEHKYGIRMAAIDQMEHLCPEGTNFRLGMKALAENRRFEVRPPHEMTTHGYRGTDVPDPETYSEPWTLTRKISGPLDGTEGS